MSAVNNFRSAFNGFNREDVVRYIEYINNKHNTAINQLNNELQAQKEELAALRAKPDQGPELLAQLEEAHGTNTALMAEMETLRAQLEELYREVEEAHKERELDESARAAQEALRQELEETKRELADAKLQLEQSRKAAAAAQVNYELEAYRRAERVERMARERVSHMYEQINAALADAALRADESAAQIGEVADRVAQQLSELQSVLAQGRNAMKDTAATIYAIRPLKPEE